VNAVHIALGQVNVVHIALGEVNAVYIAVEEVNAVHLRPQGVEAGLWGGDRLPFAVPPAGRRSVLDSMTAFTYYAVMLTLDDLSSEVTRALAAFGLLGAAPDARVSAAPDARTVRYYTTLGLLDRPSIENRQARYSERHLLQLLAIKALQAFDLPLAEIQQRLYGRSDAELKQLIEVLAAESRAQQTPAQLPALVLREVVLEPGLRLVAEEGWVPRDEAALEQKIRAALSALRKGGSR
jgi:DNA-binding transcriptional MerR regulator